MDYEISYDFIQLGLTTSDTVSEIRFYHVIKKVDTGEEVNRRLYVTPVKEVLLNMNITKEVLTESILKNLGQEQVTHMEELLIDDYNVKFNNKLSKKTYVNITL